MLSITPKLIIEEFAKRGLLCGVVDSLSPKVVLQFTDFSGHRRYINGTVGDKGVPVACRIVNDKLVTAAIAKNIGVPVPDTTTYTDFPQAAAFMSRHGTIVIKPLDSAHGNGVTTRVNSTPKLRQAIQCAQEFSSTVLLQQQVFGCDVRMLYIGGEFCAAAQRLPASVTGDGVHTVRQLVEAVNRDPERGENYQKKYNRIPVPVCEAFLGNTMESVPQPGQEVQVVGTANVGSGGTAVDITDAIDLAFVEAGKRLVAELQAGICGIDVIVDGQNYYFIEANASPSFGFHHHPHRGSPRNVTSDFVDWLLAA